MHFTQTNKLSEMTQFFLRQNSSPKATAKLKKCFQVLQRAILSLEPSLFLPFFY